MDIRYSYRVEDFEEITEAADKLNPNRRAIRFALVCGGASLLALPFVMAGGPRHPDPFWLGMCPLGVCMIALAILRNPRRVARRYYKPYLDDEEYQATINPEGIATKSRTATTQMQWTTFLHVVETGSALALYERSVVYIFPRRAFSQQEWSEFTLLASERVPARNGRLKSLHLL